MRRVFAAVVLAFVALADLPLDASRGIPYGLKFTNLSTDLVNVGNIVTDPTTISMWAWTAPTTLSTTGRIFGKQAVAGGGGFINFRLTATSGALRLAVDYSGTDATSDSVGGVVVAGQPNFIAATFDGTNAPKLYSGNMQTPVSEVSYSVQTAPVGSRVTDASGPVMIGNTTSGGTVSWSGTVWTAGWISGVLYDVKQLQALQEGTLPPKIATGGYWLLGQNGARVVIDQSGNGNNGTITGAVPVSDMLPRFGFRRAS
jgi:hypothetical protein